MKPLSLQDDLTQPQRDMLAWLVAQGLDSFGGSTLEHYYDEKRKAENPAITWGPSLGTCRAWWRTGGAMLARLHRKGLLTRTMDYSGGYSPIYRLTDTARRIGESK